MKLKNLFINIHILTIILLILLGGFVFLMFKNQMDYEKSHDIRYKSIQIANELKQSSDDLTRFCRSYVSTGNSIWEKKYWKVLAMRNGKISRSDGRKISFLEIMKNLGFTKKEFAKLREAEINSNKLVKTETKAFYAMKGLFEDSKGLYTIKAKANQEMARSIMYDKKYHESKLKIMQPLKEFFILLDKRTTATAKIYSNRSKWLLAVIIIFILLIVYMLIITFFIIKNKIIKQIDDLETAKNQAELNEEKFKVQFQEYAELNKVYKAQNDILLHLSIAVEQSASAVAITDAAGTIEFVNPAFSKTTGYDGNEAIGQNPRVLKSGKHPDKFYKEMWEVLSTGKVWKGELINKKKSGELYWENAIISPVKNSLGQITNYIAIKEDISKRKQMETDLQNAKDQAETANHAKSEFLANMSHEIRTPMNAILGFSELMLLHEKDKKKIHFLETIQNSGQTLLNLINDILDFSKIESGKMEVQKTTVSIHSCCAETKTLFIEQARAKGLSFSFELQDGLPEYLIIDKIRLQQVFNNLLSNAIKFTHKGSIKLLLKYNFSVNSENKKIDLFFSVSDSGIGIPEKQQEQIFASFEQVKGQDEKLYGGTGLGLAISKRIVELMGGNISLESISGQGSSFLVHIPEIELAGEAMVKKINKSNADFSKKTSNRNTSDILILEKKSELHLLNKNSFAHFSDSFVLELRKAVEIIDIEKLNKLIQEISKSDRKLATAIKKEIDNFQYEKLLSIWN